MRANSLTPTSSLLLLCSNLTFALEDGEKVAEKSLQPSLSSTALIETLGGLALILLLIFGLGWLLRRAVLLQVEGTRLLIGVAPGRVQTLHYFNNDPAKPEAASIDRGLDNNRKDD